jgi:thiol:disulfide interchange protein
MKKVFIILVSLFLIMNINAESISLGSNYQNSTLNDSFDSIFKNQESPLLAEEAFDISYNIKEDKNLSITIIIEPEHYLYLHKIKVFINGNEKQIEFNNYVDKYDEHYGNIKAVYDYFNINIDNNKKIENFEFEYQGCSEKFNICYPLQFLKKKVNTNIVDNEVENENSVLINKEKDILIDKIEYIKPILIEKDLIKNIVISKKEVKKEKINEQSTLTERDIDFNIKIEKDSEFLDQYIDLNKIKESISINNKFTTFLIFFIAGILISFTPCVLPMIPIISSIVIGKKENLTNMNAFFLSLSYVLGSALTYASFGAIAGLFSKNIQIYMQNPYVIITFSILLFLLALSLFGLYEIKLPNKITSKTTDLSNKLKGGQYLTVFLMGILSTLILSPCVAAPLAAGITYIAANSADYNSVLFGAFNLFSFGMGIGLVLIIITTLLNTIKIKVGVLMNEIKYLSGFFIIIVSIFIASRIIPDIVAYYLYQITILSYLISMFGRNYEKLKKGFIMLITLVTAMLYFNDIDNINNSIIDNEPVIVVEDMKKDIQYTNVNNLNEIKLDKEFVLVKFTAEWCTYCKKMEKDIFKNKDFYNELSDFKIYVVDITKTTYEKEEIMKKFRVVAPPALFFFKKEKIFNYKVGETKKEEMFDILKNITK